MRVVLDTNVFVSMTLGGEVGKINDAWKLGIFRDMPILSPREFIELLENAG